MLWRRSLIRLARTVIKSKNKAVTWRNISCPPRPSAPHARRLIIPSAFLPFSCCCKFHPFFPSLMFSYFLSPPHHSVAFFLHPSMSVSLHSSRCCSTFFFFFFFFFASLVCSFAWKIVRPDGSYNTSKSSQHIHIFLIIHVHFSSFSTWIFFSSPVSFIILPRFLSFVGSFP